MANVAVHSMREILQIKKERGKERERERQRERERERQRETERQTERGGERGRETERQRETERDLLTFSNLVRTEALHKHFSQILPMFSNLPRDTLCYVPLPDGGSCFLN